LQGPDARELARLLTPLLYDPVKAVRLEAARRLAEQGGAHLGSEQIPVFNTVVKEYEEAMLYAADFAASRHNLGNLYTALKKPRQAMTHYEAALNIDHQFYPAKVNLAMLVHQQGDVTRAEGLLREVTSQHTGLPDVHYSLALLLAEKQDYQQAVIHMRKAALGIPGRARIHYNLGLLLQRLNRDDEAETALKRALELAPSDFDFLYALAEFYLKRSRFSQAELVVNQMIQLYPQRRIGHEMKKVIQQGSSP
jgi:tetratricopeptide (TPR) repeat protein